jgi:gamma-glutamyltranspeptidase / glutathione hydrolase
LVRVVRHRNHGDRIRHQGTRCHPLAALNAKAIKDSKGSVMNDQFSNAQQIRKPAVASTGGIVAAQSRKAAEIGAGVLAAGGDCVDAVIAVTFALAVPEPWMSGLSGGGATVLYRARGGQGNRGS